MTARGVDCGSDFEGKEDTIRHVGVYSDWSRVELGTLVRGVEQALKEIKISRGMLNSYIDPEGLMTVRGVAVVLKEIKIC